MLYARLKSLAWTQQTPREQFIKLLDPIKLFCDCPIKVIPEGMFVAYTKAGLRSKLSLTAPLALIRRPIVVCFKHILLFSYLRVFHLQGKGLCSGGWHQQKQAKVYYGSQTSLANKEKERQSSILLGSGSHLGQIASYLNGTICQLEPQIPWARRGE